MRGEHRVEVRRRDGGWIDYRCSCWRECGFVGAGRDEDNVVDQAQRHERQWAYVTFEPARRRSDVTTALGYVLLYLAIVLGFGAVLAALLWVGR